MRRYSKISASTLSIGHGFLLHGEIASVEMESEDSPNGHVARVEAGGDSGFDVQSFGASFILGFSCNVGNI
ncbi:hypothetical protein [Brucella sp. LJL56]